MEGETAGGPTLVKLCGPLAEVPGELFLENDLPPKIRAIQKESLFS